MEDIMKAKKRLMVKGAIGTTLAVGTATSLVVAAILNHGTNSAVELDKEPLTLAAKVQAEESSVLSEELLLTTGKKTIGGSLTMLGKMEEEMTTIAPVTYDTEASSENEAVAVVADVEADGVAADADAADGGRTPLEIYFEDKAVVDPGQVELYLNVRSVAGSTDPATILTTAELTDIMQILEEENGWSSVVVDGITGWVSTDLLLTGEEAASYVEASAVPYAQVAVNNMNVRMHTSTASDVLMVAYENEAYPLLGMEDGWAKVKLGDLWSGYMAGNCVTLNYVWHDQTIATGVLAAAEEEVSNLDATTGAWNSGWIVDPSQVVEETDEELSSTDIVDKESAVGGETEGMQIPVPSVSVTTSAATVPTTPAATTPTTPAPTAPTTPAPTAPAATTPAPTTPAPTAPAPTTPAPTEPTAPAVTLSSIEAFYNGSAQKTEGEVIGRAEITLYGYYSDGSSKVITEGWTSSDIGMLLSAGEEVIRIEYGGLYSNIVLNVAPAPTTPAPPTPAPTEPAPTTPAPTEPAPTTPAPTEPAPTTPAPTEPAPTTPAPTEPAPTTPAPTEPAPTTPPSNTAHVNNVTLSGELTYYTLNLCNSYGVDSSIIFSVMYQESRFNPNALSGSGAVGLMQIIPRYSADRMARLGVTNLYDPASNILVGVDILAEYYHSCGSWVTALTRYRYGTTSGPSDYANLILGRASMFQ